MCLTFLTLSKARSGMYQCEGCGSDCLSSSGAFETVREGNLEGTPSEAS